MKTLKQLQSLLAVLLTMTLLLTSFGLSASAAEEKGATAGENFSWYEYFSGDSILSWQLTGDVPPSTYITVHNPDWFSVSGYAPSVGLYQFGVVINWNSGNVTNYEYRLNVNPGSTTRGQQYATMNSGEYFDSNYSIGFDGQVYEQRVEGTLPQGVSASSTSNGMRIYGTPTQTGTFNVTIIGFDNGTGTYVNQPVSITVNMGQVKVTKSPTGENVNEGGEAVFIAKAENETGVQWRLISPDNSSNINIENCSQQFAGLFYSLYQEDHTYYLTLKQMPKLLNGWKVDAVFYGRNGQVTTNSAPIGVQEKVVTAPTIHTHPQSTTQDMGKPVTLNVTATATEGRISYQWYKNAVNSTVGGTLIQGANSPSYTPDQIPGDIYYYAVLSVSSGSKVSPSVTTSVATVHYNSVAPTPTPTPFVTPKPSAAPSNTTTGVSGTEGGNNASGSSSGSAAVTVTPTPSSRPSSSSSSNLRTYLVMLVLCLVALIGLGAAFTFINAKNARNKNYNNRRR